jgi:hypothetical protein
MGKMRRIGEIVRAVHREKFQASNPTAREMVVNCPHSIIGGQRYDHSIQTIYLPCILEQCHSELKQGKMTEAAFTALVTDCGLVPWQTGGFAKKMKRHAGLFVKYLNDFFKRGWITCRQVRTILEKGEFDKTAPASVKKLQKEIKAKESDEEKKLPGQMA